MRILRGANRGKIAIIGDQKIEKGVSYTLAPYLIISGNRIFNPLTESAVLVENMEKDKAALVRGWYLVPVGFDVVSMAHMIRQRQLSALSIPTTKTGYTVFTTTACNAHCEYCFEKDYKWITMTEETAEEVARYITRSRSKNRRVEINWFGGEPLVNKVAISAICKRLSLNGVDFESRLTTNGDLLPACTDEEFALWRLKKVQITLDDVGAEYDRIKGIEGAYDRLTASVRRLNDLGVKVSARIHYDPQKGPEPCYRVASDLMDYNVSMYVRMLYGSETAEDYETLLEIESRLIKCGRMSARFPTYTNGTHCMGDKKSHAAITPDGKLSPCEHYAYGENMYGDIHTRNVSGNVLARWTEKVKHSGDCKACPLYAMCEKITMCPAEGDCSTGYRDYQVAQIKRALDSVKLEVSKGKTVKAAESPQLVCGVC